jgi:hypothetical protein
MEADISATYLGTEGKVVGVAVTKPLPLEPVNMHGTLPSTAPV